MDLQYRKNTFNLVQEAQIRRSMERTLKQTDVWQND